MKEGEGSSQRTYTPDPWTGIVVWVFPEGVRGYWVEGYKGEKTGTTVTA